MKVMFASIVLLLTSLLLTVDQPAHAQQGKANCVRCIDLAKQCGDRWQNCVEGGRNNPLVDASSPCGSWYRGCSSEACRSSCSAVYTLCVQQGVSASACATSKTECMRTGTWVRPVTKGTIPNR